MAFSEGGIFCKGGIQPMRGKNKQGRRGTRHRRFPWEALLIAASAVLFGYVLVKMIGYKRDFASSRTTADELRRAYQTETPVPECTSTPTPHPTAAATAAPVPTAAPAAVLQPAGYPSNPKLQISERFKALRKKNKEIVGWLNLGDLLDEAVVQRDEVYYMTHDALGRKNVNGAIFLDSGISLKTRPYCYILYGHNMKTGAMFGNLRNYENIG